MASDAFVPPTDVGFIGLGAMGAPMAGHLAAKGYKLHVLDASSAAVAQFQESGQADVPADLEALGASAPVVITMLPNGDIVREVILGNSETEGVAAGLKPGSVVIDMSSSSPVSTRALAAELAQRGHELIDAPVSGGTKGAVAATLAIMAGGKPETIERCRPLLESMGKLIVVGEVGSAHAMKALNNYLSAMNLAAAAEALIAGERFGLDPNVMVEIWNASTGRNTATEHKLSAFILSRTFQSGFGLSLMAKDLRLALDVARSTGAPTTLLGPLSALYDAAEERFWPRGDNTDVYRHLEALAGEGAQETSKEGHG
jgi:3-hydroxyisobutyrate dehydrogenase